jgi:hypothetical protein
MQARRCCERVRLSGLCCTRGVQNRNRSSLECQACIYWAIPLLSWHQCAMRGAFGVGTFCLDIQGLPPYQGMQFLSKPTQLYASESCGKCIPFVSGQPCGLGLPLTPRAGLQGESISKHKTEFKRRIHRVRFGPPFRIGFGPKPIICPPEQLGHFKARTTTNATASSIICRTQSTSDRVTC